MKKKLTIISLSIALICIVAGATYMPELVETLFDDLQSNEIEMSEELAFETAERKSIIEETLSAEDLPDKFSMMVAALDATVENPVKYNDIIYNYEYLKEAYKLNDEQLDYIADLIISGYDAMDVIEICYFWLDTNEDIEIVGEIYAIKDQFIGKSWIENAFNSVANDKCGVLDEEDVENYLKEGITIEDINVANKLCRKGVYTIQDILQMRKNGRTFAEIAAEVNGVSVAQIPQEATAMGTAVNMMNVMENNEEIEQEAITPQDVILSDELSRIGDESISEYYSLAIDGVELSEKLDEIDEAYSREITKDLRERGIYKTFTKEDYEEYERMLEESE